MTRRMSRAKRKHLIRVVRSASGLARAMARIRAAVSQETSRLLDRASQGDVGGAFAILKQGGWGRGPRGGARA